MRTLRKVMEDISFSPEGIYPIPSPINESPSPSPIDQTPSPIQNHKTEVGLPNDEIKDVAASEL
ncbi:hypothetical protein JHK85_009998 [Glycine max]|nr:hypothetical protein JHK85_009998 [Glycine max]